MTTKSSKQPYTVPQLQSMARTLVIAKNMFDERYGEFVARLSARIGYPSEQLERMIEIMAK